MTIKRAMNKPPDQNLTVGICVQVHKTIKLWNFTVFAIVPKSLNLTAYFLEYV